MANEKDRVDLRSNRQRKKAERREDIQRAAAAIPIKAAEPKSAEPGQWNFSLADDDVIRSTKVYNAVKAEIESSRRKPFSADNKLADPPCRFKEDNLEPFLLRIARRLEGGTPKVEFKTLKEFSSPSHKSWDAFITAMLAGDIRSLLAAITQASRTIS